MGEFPYVRPSIRPSSGAMIGDPNLDPGDLNLDLGDPDLDPADPDLDQL